MPASKIGQKIKALREERMLSQGELEKIAKINSHLISKYENGVVEPTVSNLIKIAKALQVTADYLLFDGTKKEDSEFTNPVLKTQVPLINKMNKRDQEVITRLIDAFIKKSQMEGVLKG